MHKLIGIFSFLVITFLIFAAGSMPKAMQGVHLELQPKTNFLQEHDKSIFANIFSGHLLLLQKHNILSQQNIIWQEQKFQLHDR
jgi:hypothetical protein